MSYKSWTLSWRIFELKFSGSFYFHSYDEIFADVCFIHTDQYFIRFQSLSLSTTPPPDEDLHWNIEHMHTKPPCFSVPDFTENSRDHIAYCIVQYCILDLLVLESCWFPPPPTLWVSDTSCSLLAHRVTSWDNPVFKLAALVPDFSICSPEIDTTSEAEIILSSPSGCSCGFLVDFSSCWVWRRKDGVEFP